MISTIIIFLLLTFGGVTIAYAIAFIWRAGRLDYSSRHAQWLWSSGLQESSRIVNPYLISWKGFS